MPKILIEQIELFLDPASESPLSSIESCKFQIGNWIKLVLTSIMLSPVLIYYNFNWTNIVKLVNFIILKINFLILFGFLVKITPDIRWIGLVLTTPKAHDYRRQRDKRTEIIIIVRREHKSLRTKVVISFNWGKINTIAQE